MNGPYSEEIATRSSATLSTAARRDRDLRRREAAPLARAGAKTPPFFLVFAKRLINSTSKKPKRGQKAKTLEADFKPHKAVVLANARFPRKRRGTCTRASPTARLGIGRRAHLLLSLPARARFVRRRGSRTGALVPASPEFAKSDGWRISQRESWHPARLRDTLARDVLLSVHPR